MSKSRKKNYQSKFQSEGNPFPRLTITGRILLKYRTDGENGSELKGGAAQSGDLRFYLHDDLAGAGRGRGDYEGIGYAGYLKLEVHDGKEWRLLRMDDFFPDRSHHFSRMERPIDTFVVCSERMESEKGTRLERTYREHYAREDESDL